MAETSVDWRDLEGEIETTLRETFGEVRATVRKNLAALVIGLVMVLRTPCRRQSKGSQKRQRWGRAENA
jgi:hypothetical protein